MTGIIIAAIVGFLIGWIIAFITLPTMMRALTGSPHPREVKEYVANMNAVNAAKLARLRPLTGRIFIPILGLSKESLAGRAFRRKENYAGNEEAVCAPYNVWSENDWKEKDRGEGEGVIGFLKTTAPKACQPQDIGNAKSERQKRKINRKDILKTNQDVARKQRKFPTDLRIEKRGTSSCCPGFPFTANSGEEWKNQRQTI